MSLLHVQYDLFTPRKEPSPTPVLKTCKLRGFKSEVSARNSTWFLITKNRIQYRDPFYCATCCRWHMTMKGKINK